MSFLGIDLGTSFIKGAVLDLATRRLDHIRRVPFPEPLETGNPLQCEYEPREIVTAVRTLISELAAYASDCEGLVMCSQMHGVVLMNDRNEAVSNCVTWRDQRAKMRHPSGAGSYFDLILQQAGPEVRQQLGRELVPERPVCFLFWLREQGKLVPGLIPASLPDFVLSALCDSIPGIDVTNASAHGAFNLETSDWHHDLIRNLGLHRLRWPALRKHGEVVGHLQLGPNRVPCYTPVGDAQAALAGALLTTEEFSLNISTGSQASRLSNGMNLGDYQTRPYFDGKFINTITSIPAGRSLDVLVGLLTELAAAQKIDLADSWAYIGEAAKKVADTDLEVDLNFFPGSGENAGTISNMRGENLNVGHFFRAAFKNMAESYFECACRLWPERAWKNLLFSGGLASKLDVLRETIQEKFQTSYRLSPFAEDTLYGLLILATVFSGRAKSVEELTHPIRAALL